MYEREVQDTLPNYPEGSVENRFLRSCNLAEGGEGKRGHDRKRSESNRSYLLPTLGTRLRLTVTLTGLLLQLFPIYQSTILLAFVYHDDPYLRSV